MHLVNHVPDGSVNSRFDYTFDALGRRTGMTTLDGQWTYNYDAVGQLTHAVFASTNPTVPNQDLAYEYDAAGNRVRMIVNGVVTTYQANDLNEYTTIGTARPLRKIVNFIIIVPTLSCCCFQFARIRSSMSSR